MHQLTYEYVTLTAPVGLSTNTTLSKVIATRVALKSLHSNRASFLELVEAGCELSIHV